MVPPLFGFSSKRHSAVSLMGSALILGGAIAGLTPQTADAFTISPDGSISVFKNANDPADTEGFGDVGRWMDINVGGNVNRTNLSGLASTFRMNISDFTSGNGKSQVVLDVEGYVGLQAYSPFNIPASDSNLFESYRVSVFGFQIDPDFSGVAVSGAFDTTVIGKDINANGGIDIDVCFNDGGSTKNCDGGGSGGIWNGTMETFRIVLDFNKEITSFNISNFGVRYQSINSAYYDIRGGSGTGKGQAIPEPFTIAGTAAAVGLGTLLKRKHQQRTAG